MSSGSVTEVSVTHAHEQWHRVSLSPDFCLLGVGASGSEAAGGRARRAVRPGGAALWPFRGHFSQQSAGLINEKLTYWKSQGFFYW